MNLFFVEKVFPGIITLSEEESRHFNVLRLKEQDKVWVSDGKGNYAEGIALMVSKKKVEIKTKDIKHAPRRKSYHLTIAIAPTKHNERIEWFIEKSVEIGIDNIVFINTKNTERNKINLERYKKIAYSAGKQSLTFHLPMLEGLIKFEEFLQRNVEGEKYIALCNSNLHISQVPLSKNGNYLFVVGPEGGFTKAEIDMAIKHGFEPILLSTKRLRTETAGIFITTAFEIMLG
jgi:16S rRNA (uracil1498-N3)-methyltransferase